MEDPAVDCPSLGLILENNSTRIINKWLWSYSMEMTKLWNNLSWMQCYIHRHKMQ